MVRFRCFLRFSPSGPSADRKDTLSELELELSPGRIRRRRELPSRRRSSAGGASVPRAQKAASAVFAPAASGIFVLGLLRLVSWVRLQDLNGDGPSLEDTGWRETP